MNATVSGLIETIANANPGTDWDYVPYGSSNVWWAYGGGGMGGSGSLCGVPNGCGLVLNMVGLHGNAKQVMFHYTKSLWPGDAVYDLYASDPGAWPVSEIPLHPDDVPARVVPESPLCHVSISKWCDAAGIRLTDPSGAAVTYKKDRCCKIVCDMAAAVAEIINTGTCTFAYAESAETACCMECHNTSADSVLPAQQGNMECSSCHGDDAVIVRQGHWSGGGGPGGGGGPKK
jgi:hypothetical protein